MINGVFPIPDNIYTEKIFIMEIQDIIFPLPYIIKKI